MSNISNENDFRAAIAELDVTAQRELAARFTERVLDLCDDSRIASGARMARTAHSIENEDEDEANHGEREAQYLILNEYISKRGLS